MLQPSLYRVIKLTDDRKKLQTKFLTSKQEQNETIIQYIPKLRETSRFCEFENFGMGEMPIEDELKQLRLIEGMYEHGINTQF